MRLGREMSGIWKKSWWLVVHIYGWRSLGDWQISITCIVAGGLLVNTYGWLVFQIIWGLRFAWKVRWRGFPRHIVDDRRVGGREKKSVPVLWIWMGVFGRIHPKTEAGWWFGCHEFYFPINIGNVIIPIDELIFFRGVAQPPTRRICLLGLDRGAVWNQPGIFLAARSISSMFIGIPKEHFCLDFDGMDHQKQRVFLGAVPHQKSRFARAISETENIVLWFMACKRFFAFEYANVDVPRCSMIFGASKGFGPWLTDELTGPGLPSAPEIEGWVKTHGTRAPQWC